MLSMRQRSTYRELARPADEHWVCDLVRTHHRLANALHAFRKQAVPPKYVLVRVPPFAHLVLSKAATFDEALEIMLPYRGNTSKLTQAGSRALVQSTLSASATWHRWLSWSSPL